jgi:tRNA(fMet)-specific endonuclease VapC
VNVTYMLDTNMASYIIKNQSAHARQKLLEHSEEDDVCISAITEAEIRFGMAKRKLSMDKQAAIEQFLAKMDVLPWDSTVTKEYGTMRATQEAIGKPLANMDMLIAAHAAAIGAVLVTHDSSFQNVQNLTTTVDWADDVPR